MIILVVNFCPERFVLVFGVRVCVRIRGRVRVKVMVSVRVQS